MKEESELVGKRTWARRPVLVGVAHAKAERPREV